MQAICLDQEKELNVNSGSRISNMYMKIWSEQACKKEEQIRQQRNEKMGGGGWLDFWWLSSH